MKTPAERLFEDLHFAAPELWMMHIERRMEEATDPLRARLREFETGIDWRIVAPILRNGRWRMFTDDEMMAGSMFLREWLDASDRAEAAGYRYARLSDAWAAAELAVRQFMPGAGFGVRADGPGYCAFAGSEGWHGGYVDAWSVDDAELVADPDRVASPERALERLVVVLENRGKSS